MDAEKLDQFRRRLLAERERLTTQVQDDVSTDVAVPGMASSDHALWEASGGSRNHLADDATELFLQEEELAIDNSLRSMIAEIDNALERIANGTYGKCERCGKQIPLPRLEARPFSTLCIEDKAKAEQEIAQHRAGLASRQNIR
ncbi:MAG TPA: TraR/DksA C4-type zinc finger protein [Chloroflexota bacterium]|jgi:RNA polymerase-binding protein DksA|nr:TraR/DksA C4-type zinc finger protein [Chloroflexota bacterium]